MKVYSKLWLAAMVLAVMALVLMAPASQPARADGLWYVAPGGDDANDCLSPGTACATINGAITKASPSDTIYVAIGTYTGSSDEVVLLDKDATLSGGWDADFTTQDGTSTIHGEGLRRGITVNSGVTAMIERFTVQKAAGVGIYNQGSLTLNNSTISDNTGMQGGGICNDYGTLTLNNSTISDNAATYGGGIYNAGTLILNNSTVSDNTAGGEGGGICNLGETLTLNSSTVSGNTASTSST